MNGAYAHLLLNHIPVFGTLFGAVLLLVAVLGKKDVLKRAGLGVFVAVAVLTIATYLTGEPAEDVVENLNGVSESVIEDHEESALLSLFGIELLGAASLTTLWVSRKGKSFPRFWAEVCWLFSIVALLLVAWTSHLGGQIRHTETRPGFQVPSSGPTAGE